MVNENLKNLENMLPSVTSNQILDVFVYLIILCICTSSGHNEVSKTPNSPNPCKAFILLGQTNKNKKIMQFQISINP